MASVSDVFMIHMLTPTHHVQIHKQTNCEDTLTPPLRLPPSPTTTIEASSTFKTVRNFCGEGTGTGLFRWKTDLGLAQLPLGAMHSHKYSRSWFDIIICLDIVMCRKGGTHSFFLNIYILSRFYTQCGAQHGAWTHDPEIETWAEIKSWTLNKLSHPDALGETLSNEQIHGEHRPVVCDCSSRSCHLEDWVGTGHLSFSSAIFSKEMCLLSHTISCSGQNNSTSFCGVECSLPFLHLSKSYLSFGVNLWSWVGGSKWRWLFPWESSNNSIEVMKKEFLRDVHHLIETTATLLVRLGSPLLQEHIGPESQEPTP